MAYVAPTWRNGQAPALDAAALQAISDAIVANQTKNTQQDSSISSLQTAVNGKSRVATGSYTGTGTYGESNPNSITFPFTPKLVILYGEGNTDIIKNRNTRTYVNFLNLSTSYTSSNGFMESRSSSYPNSYYAKRNGNTLYWYGSADRGNQAQYNYQGTVYNWIAFG